MTAISYLGAMRRWLRPWLFVLAGASLGLLACRRGETTEDAPDASASAPSASATAAFSAPAASSSAPQPKPPLQLLKFHFTSGIEAKEPADQLLATAVGERVYVHLTIRNRSGAPRKVNVQFRVGTDKRTTLDLDVQPSWSFRTWGFNTVRKGDEGDLSVDVTDDEGNLLASEKIPIKSKVVTKKLLLNV